MTAQAIDAARPDTAASRRPNRPRPIRNALGRHWYAWAMVAPVVTVLAVLVIYPLFRGLYLSLTNANEANIGHDIGVNHIAATYHFVGLANYINILSGNDGTFYPRLIWTLVWTAICVFLHYTIGLGLASLLNRPMRFRIAYRMMLILPWAVPGFVSAFAWRLILNGNAGALDNVLTKLGLPSVDWLGQPLPAKISVITVNVWLGVPFMMVAILGGLQAIPRELHEAAEVDGATAWQRFRHVTIPGLRPISGTIILLGIIWTFNQFAVIFLVTAGGPGGATDILVTQAYNEAFNGVQKFAAASTYGAIILSMLLIFATVYRRVLRGASTEAAS
jgi:arabinogalactan oligomer / maltooligosaccharide transport system permease protein